MDTIIQHCFNVNIFLPLSWFEHFSVWTRVDGSQYIEEKSTSFTFLAYTQAGDNLSPWKKLATCSMCAGIPITQENTGIDITLFHQTKTTKMQSQPEIKPSKWCLGLPLPAKAMSDMSPQVDLPCKTIWRRNNMERPNKLTQSMAMYYLAVLVL